MSRKNRSAAAIHTFSEFSKSKTKSSVIKSRLGKDSIKHFNACNLCLSYAIEPLVCPKGHIFCKACIYSSLLSQKQKIKKQQLKNNKKLIKQEEKDKKEQLDQKNRELDNFLRAQTLIKPIDNNEIDLFENERKLDPVWRKAVDTVCKSTNYTTEKIKKRVKILQVQIKTKITTTVPSEREAKTVDSFWLPSEKTSEAVDKEIIKHTLCPQGHGLKLKQLKKVKFSLKKPDEKKPNSNKLIEGNITCGGCDKTLTNTHKLIMARCGHVVCVLCADKFLYKDETCIVCGSKAYKKDCINLQAGGTGFSERGNLKAEKFVLINY